MPTPLPAKAILQKHVTGEARVSFGRVQTRGYKLRDLPSYETRRGPIEARRTPYTGLEGLSQPEMQRLVDLACSCASSGISWRSGEGPKYALENRPQRETKSPNR